MKNWSSQKPSEAGYYWMHSKNKIHLVGLQKRTEPNGEHYMLCAWTPDGESGWSFDIGDSEFDELEGDEMWIKIDVPVPPKRDNDGTKISE